MAKVSVPAKVRKRNGSFVTFDIAKIQNAIERAALEVLGEKQGAATVARRVADQVLKRLTQQYKAKIPHVEDIQDMVEFTLMAEGYNQIAKSYILFRESRHQIRFTKSALGMKDDLKLPVNTMEVLQKRYLLKDENQNVVETPGELFRRVAHHVAKAEDNFRTGPGLDQVEEKFYRMMRNLEFMPNSPTLMNAGTSLRQLSACFVIPVPDSIEGIFTALGHMAQIHQTGGGTGFSFSDLRPQADIVHSTKGQASGPVSFMSIFDKATGVIVQGGRRRGANMGILRCDHPDIIEFIEAKTQPDQFTNFNLSVGVTEKFMRSAKENKDFELINPRTGKVVRKIKAGVLFDLIANAAWRTGDPGLVFLDEINRRNPTPAIGRIEATNPCGELPLLPYESCNLGSINLARMAKPDLQGLSSKKSLSGTQVDWQRLKECIRLSVRFLDDVIEVNNFPLPQIRSATLANRKIGLGVMGFADMLIMLGIPYNSVRAVNFAQKLMRFIHEESLAASAALAQERGVFPNFSRSIYSKGDLRLHNATVNTIAPTGTISIIAGCSSGIEPLFAISFVRNVLSGTKLFEINPLFEAAAKRYDIYDREILAEVAKRGSLQRVKGIPEELKRIFVTAFDISPTEHVRIQAAFQKYTDNAVSKTINLPADASVEDVRNIYLLAHRLKCKGITIYRYGSKPDQVLSFSYGEEAAGTRWAERVTAAAEYSGGCAVGACAF
ncbi:MAG: adenosylcobalamin-dependent ribonucleoside-diphosphate reductase [Syntrophaceae bacterium]|nr:adenosylcobalamin-dependent ribonucleoside-diphosphate reductase [Syntrophaceae bacterium]